MPPGKVPIATGLDIVTDALTEIGEYAPSEVLSGADSSYGLIKLNDLLDSWSNESLICFAIQEQSAPLQVGIWSYTIGPGGMWNMPRPLRIPYGDGRAYIMDSGSNRYPVEVLQRTDWNLIGNLENINSDIPTRLFYDPQFPLGVINVWPVPLTNWTLFWDSYLPLVNFRDLSVPAALPPGYMRALKLNLALELWGGFKPDGSTPSPLLVGRAAKALAAVKRSNVRPYRALFDRALLRFPRSSYNIYRGM